MSEETLLTAARRVVRFFNIDMHHGGLVSIDTQQAIDTLDMQVRMEAARQTKETRHEPDRQDAPSRRDKPSE